MKIQLENIFISFPEKWFTKSQIKEMLYSRLGFEYPEREFNEMFLAFRKSFVLNNKKVLHCKIYGNHRYILSDKKCNIILHNANLNWEQRNSEQRKIKMM